MKEEVLINGNLYIKKGPKKVLYEHDVNLKGETYQFDGEEIDAGHEYLDWSYVNDLHRLIIKDDSSMFLYRRDTFGGVSKDYEEVTLEELINNYISLSDFLVNAKYIGRKGYRTKPTTDGDKSYVNDPVTVLYVSDTHIMVYDDKYDLFSSKGNIPIQLLDFRFVNNWEFNGPDLNIYKDPKELCTDLYKEGIVKNKTL